MCSFRTIAFHRRSSGRDVGKMIQRVKVSFIFVYFGMSGSRKIEREKQKPNIFILSVVLSIKINRYLLSPTHRANVRNTRSFVFRKHSNNKQVEKAAEKESESKAAARTSVGSASSEMVSHQMET